MAYFQDWLSKSFKPCCNVLCSNKAKEIIAQNNLTPSEFLRPFGDFRGKKLQIQFNEKDKDKEPISLNDLIIDFYDSEDYEQIKQESIINYIETMFKQNEPSWNLNSPLVTKNLLEPVKSKLIEGQYCTPWFKEFEKTILECLNFDEYELYQQPIINIFIAHIGEKASVINEQLVKKVPKIIKEKRYDSSKESVIIILNDCKDKILKKEEIEKSKSRFAIYKNYYIFNWDINCPPFADIEEKEQKKINDNYKKYFHRKDIYNSSNANYKDYMRKQYGKYINMEQYRKYREEFLYYFSNVFLPKMQEKILNPFYDIIKKNTGFSNIFKKKDILYYRNTKIYRFSELERSYYNLGLLYFYFHNYDLSNENLKLLRNSLKEKSDSHKDRVKELKAMSKFLQKKIAKKEFNILEEIKLGGNVYQVIRQELIIIKMLESKLKDNNKENKENKDYKDNKADMIELVKMIYRFKRYNKDEFLRENKESIIKYFNALLEEKLAVYNLFEKKFRKYVFHMAITGKFFQQLEMNNYSLFCLSKLLYFIDNPSPSFIRLRMHYNQLLGEICNSVKYVEGSFKFFRNSFEFSCLNFTGSSENQNKYLQYYLSIFTQIKVDKTVYNNIDLNELNIPQVDNASLFVLENDDYDIKQRSDKMENSKEKSWLVFNKYAESLTTDVYASLDEIDLNHIKLIHDLTNETNKKITNVHTDRFFQGNINQKLFVRCTIRNPLGIEIQVSSIKLFCSFIPNKGSSGGSTIKKPLNNNDIKDKDKKESNNLKNEIKEEKEIKEQSNENIILANKDKESQKNIDENKILDKKEIKEDINKIENKEEEKLDEKVENKIEEKESEKNKEKSENKKDIQKEQNENDKVNVKEINNNENENKINEENNKEKEIIEENIEEKRNEEIKAKEETEEKNKEIIEEYNENLKEEEIKNIDKEENKDIENIEKEISKKENKEEAKDKEKNPEKEENVEIKEKVVNDEINEKQKEEIFNEKKDDVFKGKEENKETENNVIDNKNEKNSSQDITMKENIKTEKVNNNENINIENDENNKNEVNNIEKEKGNDLNEEKEKEKNKENEIKEEKIINEETRKKENENENKENKDEGIDINDFEIINSVHVIEENEEKTEEIKLNNEENVDENEEKDNEKNEKEKEPMNDEKNKEIMEKIQDENNQEIDKKDNIIIEKDKKETEKIENKINSNDIQNKIENKEEESKEEIIDKNKNSSNNQPQIINAPNLNENETKESISTSRTSLEKNFKIESHQNDANNINASNTPEPRNEEQITNPSKNEKNSNPQSQSPKKEIQNVQNILSRSTCDKKLEPGQSVELELNVSSSQEGKIIVKGLEFSLFSQCKIIHLFSKKYSPSLYYYINRKKIFTMGGASHISSSSSSDYESRNSSELAAKNLLLNNIIIPRKNKIEYIVRDFKNDLYVSFPLGTKVNAFLYQLYFLPILIKNNSPTHRVRRYSIFIEDCDKTKLKSFLNYITRDNKIKQRGSQDLIFIPIIPMSTGKLYLKIIIKFITDLRQKTIQVKRYLIKLIVRESISFEVKEYCSNLKEDKDGKTYNKIDFNIKTNLRIRNEKEIKDLKLREPLYNKDLNLINQKNYLINNDEIHKKYVFDKETNFSKNPAINNNEIKFNFDFIQKIIDENLKNVLENNNENKQLDTNYIINKFKKILNNSNSNTIFFPWEATYTKSEENKAESSDNSENEQELSKAQENGKEVILYGLYPYKLKMKNSETTKTFLSFLFNKFTDLKISTKKIDKQKTLIKMILKLDKIGLASMGDKIEKYEIIASDTSRPITWLGPKKFIVKNNLDENYFTCRFNFITTLKGNIEVNRISVLVYKRPENNVDLYSVININHITKPTSIFID